MHLIHPGSTRTGAIVADEGPLRGHTVGATRDHWDGRRDAKVRRAVASFVPRRMRVDDDRIVLPRPMIWAPPSSQRGLSAAAAMAITASGLFYPTERDKLDNSDLVIDWVNDTIKMALFTNTITPSFSADTAYGVSPYNANEVSGTGYSAGGDTLGSKTISESPTGTLMVDSDDPQWTGATFLSARGGLVWDDTVTIVADAALCLVNFGADYSVTAGTFTVQLASGGLYTIDLTP